MESKFDNNSVFLLLTFQFNKGMDHVKVILREWCDVSPSRRSEGGENFGTDFICALGRLRKNLDITPQKGVK